MANDFKRNVSITGIEEFTNIRLGEPVRDAAGMLGVKEALKHGFKEMGVLRSMGALLKMNQKDGFDCPSCAWPDPENRSLVAEYCENGAKALADEATTAKADAGLFKKWTVEELSQLSDYELNKFGRLIEPLVLRPNSVHYEPITWTEAYGLIAKHLERLEHPDEAIFYTSGRSSNEAAFLYGMFARAFGTNNMPDCSNMCHESSGVALGETLGIGKGSTVLEDLYEAEVIIIAGQNPGTNHPRMMSALEKCKNNGGKIISINPLEESGLVNFKNPQHLSGTLGGGVQMADLHLPVNINQDIPLMKLILKKLATLDSIDHKVFDHAFIEKYTAGYDAFLEGIMQYDEADLLARAGVKESDVNKAVAMLRNSERIIVCWAMGLTQHKNGVENIREFVNLLLLKGALGKPGAGTCPVRGHSNVQGDRSVGIQHFVDEAMNARIKEFMHFDPPTKKGLDVVESMEAMHDGKAKAFFCLGGNFLMAASDTNYTAEAIQNCELSVQISTKLNRTHLVTGNTALILPTLGRSEKDNMKGKQQYFTVENSMGKVSQSKGILKPVSGNVKSEPLIIAEIADSYFKGNHPVNWKAMGEDYGIIREYIDLVAKGFNDTSKRSEGHGYYLPNNVRNLDFSMLPEGRAQITVNKLPQHTLAEDEFMLMTIRSHDQFNTTIYGLNDRYRGVYNERRIVFMNQKDMDKLGLQKLDVVDITSEYDGILRKANKFLMIPYNIPKGNIASYFPETNILVPYNHFAERSQTPISKSVRVKIHKQIKKVDEVV
ncbi:molybdopterin-dependent oxidoreductase alpha subunit [Leeuwenhoekiella aestuarii]|uniref:Molybdopterin-dependent oxidoreductase alpha subunit n=1 Tax=Leeuwenhoekiella aestuarii TaxID=2249426 RepID=A0A4Q0NQD8_9FLAO|nr:FdhF/YdeP family oxidoreductase [Leeuwenhoekiella aestuarii]RXG11953.1 molybdopterin-dependent oxidoreductase alpha subunit [Leeuwenhoekiella aestuarii]RXG13511.1 molybdopterin-dependent oxidoreductase alpha subunit [Leeuwenhoekiella aestuarii]